MTNPLSLGRLWLALVAIWKRGAGLKVARSRYSVFVVMGR
jgi:hypothetical protein